jgi:SM-20-related protein
MLNAQLNPSDLRHRFDPNRRVVVRDILQPAAADAIWNCMAREVPWELVFRRGNEAVTLDEAALARIDGSEMAKLTAAINAQAQNDFQFVYWKFSMVDAYRRQILPHLVLHRVLESLASAEMIAFVRSVTGLEDIQRVDAQATLYRPGNFLTAHSDEETGSTRRAAYVIQLCRNWRAEWGGLLQFLGADGGVTETFVPGYNQMALFAVPQEHTVSMVTPFAGAPRLAITGWFTA